jgi:CHAT domain-containing protein
MNVGGIVEYRSDLLHIKLDLQMQSLRTYQPVRQLSDEAVHIAGGMMLAGYRGVMATMWSIEDDLAPEVADEFYCHIMEGDGRPDNRKAAEALHFAIQKLRKRRDIPLIWWIPFVHMGV